MTLNRDSIVAICLLVICGGLAWASLDIREPDYGVLSPAVWPRVIVGVMTVLGVIFLVQSLRAGPDAPREGFGGAAGFYGYWRNVIWCFVLFGAYLIAIPYVGILLGGMAFVFLLLTALGGVRNTVLHIVIALATVGGMWAVFTFALRVILPRGDWTGF